MTFLRIKQIFNKSKYVFVALFILAAPVFLLVPHAANAATDVAITSPTNGSTATGTSFTVTGTATADRLITVTVNGDEAGTTTSDGSGDWSLEVTGQDPGAKTIEATASVGYAYVANRGSATISVINTVTDEKVGSDISSAVNQQTAVVSPDGTQMVTVSGFGVGNAIKVWSLTDPEVPVITHNLTTALTHAVAVFYSPDGNYFFVSSEAGNFSSGMVRRYDSSDPTTSADVTGYNQNFPAYLAFSSDSSRLYAGNVISGTISVINVATNTQLSTFASSGGGGPLMSDDINGYSVRNNNDSVYPYNVQSETTGSPIAVGDGPVGSTFNQDQSRLLVANTVSHNISVINTGTNTVVDTVSTGTGSNPYTMAFANDYSKVYLAEYGLDQISILDPTTLAETGTIAVGDAPSAVAMGPTQTATTSTSFTLEADTDTDNDTVSNDIEDAAPNSGDANNDGTADSEQAHVASSVDPVTGEYAVLEVDEQCTIESLDIISESDVSSEGDTDFSYPAGLMDFRIDCGENGFTATIKQYYYDVSGDFIVRKFKPSTGYFAIDNATVSDQTIDSRSVKVASYQVTDGDSLDLDDAVNGSIEDPAGLAQAVTDSSDPLADTGQNTNPLILLSTILLTSGLAVAMYAYNKQTKRKL